MLRGNQSLLNRLRCESRAGPANSSSLSTSRRRRSRSTNSTTGPRLSRAANRSCHSSPHLLARICIQSEDKASPSAIGHGVIAASQAAGLRHYGWFWSGQNASKYFGSDQSEQECQSLPYGLRAAGCPRKYASSSSTWRKPSRSVPSSIHGPAETAGEWGS